MKFIIQIPCYNEEKTLAITLKELPREVNGFDTIEWLIVDDGSTDNTVNVARENGVDHIISHTKNKGLAAAFKTGIQASLRLGADVIVNTDADNQYNAEDIPLLTTPILQKSYDIVIGARPISEIEHFSSLKKFLQKFGSWTVQHFSNTDIADATSGFRAISRNAAKQISIFSEYTYTLETIIQAGQKNIAITSVPIRVNKDLRPSKLVKSIPSYIQRSIITIIRIFAIYQPFRFFFYLGTCSFILGILIGIRFLYYYYNSNGEGHIQSLILCSIFLGAGIQIYLVAFIADLIAANRKLLEEIKNIIQ